MTPIDPQKLAEAIDGLRTLSRSYGPHIHELIDTVLAALTKTQEQLIKSKEECLEWASSSDGYSAIAYNREQQIDHLKAQLVEAKEQLKNTEIQVGLEMSAVKQLKVQLADSEKYASEMKRLNELERAETAKVGEKLEREIDGQITCGKRVGELEIQLAEVRKDSARLEKIIQQVLSGGVYNLIDYLGGANIILSRTTLDAAIAAHQASKGK